MRGLDALASYLEEVLASGDDEAVADLEAYGIGAARVAVLRQRGTGRRQDGIVAATPARRVTQRTVDIQDGRVLYLIEKVVRAYRTAHRADPSILKPQLKRIAWMFDTRKKTDVVALLAGKRSEIVRFSPKRWRFTGATTSAVVRVPGAMRIEGLSLTIQHRNGRVKLVGHLADFADHGVATTFTAYDRPVIWKGTNGKKPVEMPPTGETGTF